MKIHAIQTGLRPDSRPRRSEGQGHGLPRRMLAIFTDRHWTDWLADLWRGLIDHPEGIIVVDTGQGRASAGNPASRLHPFIALGSGCFRIEREQEIGPQLRTLGNRTART